jgi:hypothetical protein
MARSDVGSERVVKQKKRVVRVAKHLRLAKWLVDAVEARGRPEKRTFSVQLAWELEQIPAIASMKPKG